MYLGGPPGGCVAVEAFDGAEVGATATIGPAACVLDVNAPP